MKKWIICQYGRDHIQAPYSCNPIGLAYEKTHEDSPDLPGFVDFQRYSSWLIKKDYCAFGDGYAKYFPANVKELRVIYAGA